MKTVFFFLLGFVLITTSCKKDGAADVQPGSNPGGSLPTAVVGKWMYGSFSMADFWTYNGTYAGKPFELAVVFDFKANGTYEKYFVSSARDYSCRTEAFTYEKGIVKFSEADGSFTCTPTEGKYRGFYSCVPSRNIDRSMEKSEMKVQTYYYELKTGSNGKPTIVVRFNRADENVSTFLPTSW
ncbi:hypothetical protein [Fibrella aquatilis]|uniref:Uncharacterized protein n=1 Tax=Fibrella aquatilis TaxID=2817059 RepID=A0A939G1G6_9BACT|nr:hypothetical protein [Fibrella aquatilis]MBO0930259.1 hypothetical protein [Fibrella aquatilis]